MSTLIVNQQPDLFLYLGDVYERGTRTEYHNWYGLRDNLYGRLRDITNPTVGNHEYLTPGAAGYFFYWDNVPHYYSYDTAGWHFVSLDLTETYNQVAPTTAQYKWLENDLKANTLPCVLVYFHHPRYSIGPQGDTARVAQVWSLLAQYGVDVVLTGHDHSYQRWTAVDGSGNPAPQGITQFVVGNGGYGTQGFVRTDSRVAGHFDCLRRVLCRPRRRPPRLSLREPGGPGARFGHGRMQRRSAAHANLHSHADAY